MHALTKQKEQNLEPTNARPEIGGSIYNSEQNLSSKS